MLYLSWRKWGASLWPIRIISAWNAYVGPAEVRIFGFRAVEDHLLSVKVSLKTLKRTSERLELIHAYIGKNMVSVAHWQHEVRQGTDQQEIIFGPLPPAYYVGENLVIVIEDRLRKGPLAIKHAVRIDNQYPGRKQERVVPTNEVLDGPPGSRPTHTVAGPPASCNP